MNKECNIKDLGPETLYYFRLGVTSELGGKEVLSEILTTATQDAPPMLFYLFKSAERGDRRGLSTFLTERKDSAALDAFDRIGETALIKAVKRKDLWTVKKMLSAGAIPDQGDYGAGRSPLIHACSLGYTEVAEVLIQAGADVCQADCNKCSPLHYAAESNHLDSIRLCIECGAKVNAQDSIGWTPLMRAVIFNCSEVTIRELIGNGADIKIKDRNNKTALDLAKINMNNSVIKILEEHSRYLQEPKEEVIGNLKIVACVEGLVECSEKLFQVEVLAEKEEEMTEGKLEPPP